MRRLDRTGQFEAHESSMSHAVKHIDGIEGTELAILDPAESIYQLAVNRCWFIRDRLDPLGVRKQRQTDGPRCGSR